MKKIAIIVVILAIIAGVAFWRFGYLLTQKKIDQPINLQLWGLWEDERLIKPAIDAYKKVKPNVTITYNHQNSPNYRTRVQTQVSEGNYAPPPGVDPPPDVFMIHNSWLPMFLKNNNLSPLPSNILSLEEFRKTFYPVAEQTLTKDGIIYALPMEVDGLALFYNEDMIKEANVEIPQNWDQFEEVAQALTKRDERGNITQAGAAMGATGNVDHWPDIIGLLFYQQPGASLENPANSAGADVIRFFTKFTTHPNPAERTWGLTMESSTEAFYSGRLAFYFAPSWRAHELREANLRLNFKTAPVPQLQKADPKDYAGWGSFWAFAVSSKSPHPKEAWEFAKFLTSAVSQKLLYQEASKERLFGQPYSRVDLQKEIINEPIVGSFVSQGPIYKGWYLSSKTFDQGLNDEMITYFENAINATVQGADPLRALQTTESGVKQTLDKHTKPTQASPAQEQ